jgi:hypothetical protein
MIARWMAQHRSGGEAVHIFVDESGNFRPRDGAESRFSCVAAIAIPSSRREPLYREYASIRARLFTPRVEPKGSQLTATEAREILGLLARHDAVLDACVIDAGIHHVAEIREFQEMQAESLIADLDRAVQPEPYVETMTRVSRDTARLPPQLFIQCWAMVILLHRLMQTLTLHFVLRQPRELGRIHWDVDPKDVAPTVYERAWGGLILPLVAELTKREPIIFKNGGDYSQFARFEKPIPEEARVEFPEGRPWDPKAINAEAILEELEFPRSEDCSGLQLADMAASVLSRAFNGNMEREGWIALAPLLARDFRGRPLRMLRMVGKSGQPLDPRGSLHPRHLAMIMELARSARWRAPQIRPW